MFHQTPEAGNQTPETGYTNAETGSQNPQASSPPSPYGRQTPPHPSAGSQSPVNGQQNQSPASTPYGYYNAPQTQQLAPVTPPPLGRNSPPRRKKKGRGKLAAFIAAGCVLSASFGFIGGAASNLWGSGSGGGSTLNQLPSNQVSSPAADGSVASVADIAMPSVVSIVTESVQRDYRFGDYVSEGAGSGVILTADGYIATNHHVIEGASKVKVTLADGTEYDATIVGYDAANDLAVLKIDATDLTPVTLGKSGELSVGDMAVVIGNPLGTLGGTVTDGIISALDRQLSVDGTAMTLLQTSAAVNPGNSGGGLFNASGQLVGIVNAKSSGTDIEGLGFAIPIDIAAPILNEIIDKGGSVGNNGGGENQQGVGLTLQDIGVEGIGGAVVTAVAEGSAAEEAGIQVGDYILQIGDTQVESAAHAAQLIGAASGETTVAIQRGDRTGRVSLNCG